MGILPIPMAHGEKLVSEQEALPIGVIREGFLGKGGTDMDFDGWVGFLKVWERGQSSQKKRHEQRDRGRNVMGIEAQRVVHWLQKRICVMDL